MSAPVGVEGVEILIGWLEPRTRPPSLDDMSLRLGPLRLRQGVFLIPLLADALTTLLNVRASGLTDDYFVGRTNLQ